MQLYTNLYLNFQTFLLIQDLETCIQKNKLNVIKIHFRFQVQIQLFSTVMHGLSLRLLKDRPVIQWRPTMMKPFATLEKVEIHADTAFNSWDIRCRWTVISRLETSDIVGTLLVLAPWPLGVFATSFSQVCSSYQLSFYSTVHLYQFSNKLRILTLRIIFSMKPQISLSRVVK